MNPIIYNIFPEVERFDVVAQGGGFFNTAQGVDGNFVRAGVEIDRSARLRTASIGPRTEVWWHFLTDARNTNLVDGPMVILEDTISGREFARIDGNNGEFALETSASGSSFTRDDSQTFTGVATGGNPFEVDIRVVLDPTGNSTIEVFVNRSSVILFEGPLGTATFCDAVSLLSPEPFGNPTRFYELLAADSPTFGMRIASNEIEVSASPADFTGLISDVASFDSGLDAVLTAQPGNEHAFQLGDLSAIAGTSNPIAVFVQATAQGSVDVGSFDVGLRIGGTPVLQNNPVTAGFDQIGAAFDFNNPVTGLPWTVTDIDNFEAFFRANT